MKVEYRVRPVTRYIVTRFYEELSEDGQHRASGCDPRGEFDNVETAYQVAYALCKAEHQEHGEPINSMSFIYPQYPVELVGDEVDTTPRARA